ncbi:hypothetical protein AGMMS49941_12040 [Deferribacterales bacterium]|nr:hypothetical protein AGMMS49941_12040 [Deferribacterales bacterium]
MRPNVKKIGFVYCPGEVNSVTLMRRTQEASKELGLELITAVIANTADVKQATSSIISKVDAIYVTNDNTVVSALPSLTNIAIKHKVPVISADPSSAKKGNVTVAYGVDNYKIGLATGKMVAEVLRGKKTSAMPIKVMDQPDEMEGYINEKQLTDYKLKVPNYVREVLKVAK